MEVVTLRADQLLLFFPGPRVMVTLRNSKKTGRHGGVEQVFCSEPLVIASLRVAVAIAQPGTPLYSRKPAAFRHELRWLASLLGINRADLSPYGLRRVGAAAHFLTYGNFDTLCDSGRREQTATARIYAEGGAADLASLTWSLRQKRLTRLAGGVLAKLLQRELQRIGDR